MAKKTTRHIDSYFRNRGGKREKVARHKKKVTTKTTLPQRPTSGWEVGTTEDADTQRTLALSRNPSLMFNDFPSGKFETEEIPELCRERLETQNSKTRAKAKLFIDVTFGKDVDMNVIWANDPKGMAFFTQRCVQTGHLEYANALQSEGRDIDWAQVHTWAGKGSNKVIKELNSIPDDEKLDETFTQSLSKYSALQPA